MPSKYSILVVEDDPDVLAVILKHLKYHQYNAVTASDGMEGLKLLDGEQFDLVITDIVMPYVSGIGIVSRAKSKDKNTPVIAITGFGKEPELLANESKADLVLSKPVKMSVLMEHVRRLLGDAP